MQGTDCTLFEIETFSGLDWMDLGADVENPVPHIYEDKNAVL